MTIVKNDSADNFVRRPPKDIRLFFVHGSEEGLVHERAKRLVSEILRGDRDPLRSLRLEGDAIARDPGALFDEAYSISMFGGHRAIWIEMQSRDLAPVLEPLLKSPPQECSIVVEAGSAKKGSPLRNAFEKAANAYAIECYPDDRRALLSIVTDESKEANVEIASDAREYLVSLLGSDRLTSRSEIAKLMLYARATGRVEIADVEAIVSDAAPSTLDAAIDAALAGDLSETERTATRYFDDGGDAGFLVMRLIARVILLRQIRLDVERGRSVESAIQSQFVRLPPAGRAALTRQAERWTSANLGKRMVSLLSLAGRARRDSRLAPILTTRALWTLASGARARGGG